MIRMSDETQLGTSFEMLGYWNCTRDVIRNLGIIGTSANRIVDFGKASRSVLLMLIQLRQLFIIIIRKVMSFFVMKR